MGDWQYMVGGGVADLGLLRDGFPDMFSPAARQRPS